MSTAAPSSTPIPALPLIVLSIAMLGEFLSANVSTPFLIFMVKGFGGLKDEAEVAYWTGILVSVFFITQFVTSLLWSTIADKYGRRLVLLISLLGSATACALFGTSASLAEAITIRLLQGIFAGAIGVARSSVTVITDPSNEGKAYAILGFCWGLGGVSGAIIGGAFESPSQKWPHAFPIGSIFHLYPYLLPCVIAGSITLSGAILALFLDRNGGSRNGNISLPVSTEDNVEERRRFFSKFIRFPLNLLKGLASYTSSLFRLRGTEANSIPPPSHSDALPLEDRLSAGSSYTYTRTGSLINGRLGGHSYRRNEARRNVRPHLSNYSISPISNRDETRLRGLNFTQRLILANEHGMNTMSDFWVDAAMTETAFQRGFVPPGLIRDPFLQDLDSNRLGAPERVQHSQMNVPSQSVTPSIFDHTGLRIQSTGDQRWSSSGPTSNGNDAAQRTSLWSQLPIAVILQYGFLALHSTVHDQIFLSYLVSSYDVGGLGLSASHFAQLIALMCLAQIAYQFYLYPNFGPPRGKFSHLAMFRLGAVLFVPAYLSVIVYRGLTSTNPRSDIILMILLSLSTAIRFCGSTFAYTSIAILLNYLSPPHVNGLANGVAQSIVSFARFVGPILGGYIWSTSIENGPDGYPWSFIAVASICILATVHSFTIR